MKRLLTLSFFLCTLFALQAQTTHTSSIAFNGEGDKKLQIGTTLQKNARGISASYDYGITHNLSVGVFSSYMLKTNTVLDAFNPNFKDLFNAEARLNANIGNVINIDKYFDVYPGIHLGLKNFGGHLGVRYFFSHTFGVYSEFSVPFATYDNSLDLLDKVNNQFTANIGACFHF